MTDPDPFRLDGKVALVTGAGRGIGAAIAVAMSEAGADVGLVARTASDLDQVADQIRARGRRAAVIVEDLARDPDPHRVIATLVDELGALDVLVNNAGGASPGPFADVTAALLDDAFHFNVSAPFELVKAAVPRLLERPDPSVVNVSSNLGHLAAPGYVVYGTVKAAVSQLTRLLAADLAPHIRVNGVARTRAHDPVDRSRGTPTTSRTPCRVRVRVGTIRTYVWSLPQSGRGGCHGHAGSRHARHDAAGAARSGDHRAGGTPRGG